MRNIRVRLVSVAKRARKRFEVEMRKAYLQLLSDLQAMLDRAKTYAISKEKKDKQRQIWIRIMTYIGQVMNSISKSFDEAQVTDDLKRLK